MQQHVWPIHHLADVQIKRWTLDPLHEKDREPVAADEYSFRRVREIREVRSWRGLQVLLNRAISLIAIAEVASKTTHGEVAVSIRRFQLVNVSKLARGYQRHSQSIDSRQRVSQQRMRETDRRALNGFSEIAGGRPVFRSRASLCRRQCH